MVLAGLEGLKRGLLMYHELGLTTKEIHEDLKRAGWGKSLTTLKRYQTDLRKEGLLPASTMARDRIAPKSERKPVENSTPIPPTTESNNDSQVPATPTPEQHRVQDDGETTTLVTVMPTQSKSDIDHERCAQLLEEIEDIIQPYSLDPEWTKEHWLALGGLCRTIQATCDARGGYKRTVSERAVFTPSSN